MDDIDLVNSGRSVSKQIALAGQLMYTRVERIVMKQGINYNNM